MKPLLLLLKPIALAGTSALAMLPWVSNTSSPARTSAFRATAAAVEFDISQRPQEYSVPPDKYAQVGYDNSSWSMDITLPQRRMHLAGDDVPSTYHGYRPWMHRSLTIVFQDPCDLVQEVPLVERPTMTEAERHADILYHLRNSLSIAPSENAALEAIVGRALETSVTDTLWRKYGIYTTRTMYQEPFWHGWVRERYGSDHGDPGIALTDRDAPVDTLPEAQMQRIMEALQNLKPVAYTYDQLRP